MESLFSPKQFFLTLRKITKSLLQGNNYEALQTIDENIQKLKKISDAKSQILQLKSVRGQALIVLSKFQDAQSELTQVLKQNPYHFLSLKRRAALYQKTNKIQKSIQQYTKCSFMDCQSRNIRARIKRLQSKLNQIQQEQSQLNNTAKSENSDQQSKSEKSSSSIVTFGSFQVIQIATEESDEHFAVIKNEIDRLSEKKPKKSILKDSLSSSFSTFQSSKSHSSHNSDKQQYFEEKIQEKIELKTQQALLQQKQNADAVHAMQYQINKQENMSQKSSTLKKVVSIEKQSLKKKSKKKVSFKIQCDDDQQ